MLLAVAPPLAAGLQATFPIEAYDPGGLPDAAASGPSGLTPNQMRGAYGLGIYSYSGGVYSIANPVTFHGIPADGSGQTIAIVDAYDDPYALSDLNAFSSYSSGSVSFDLPTFNSGPGSPTFTKMNENGGTSLPGTDPHGPYSSSGNLSWATEESLDIEWAHAMAPMANIILVEASSDYNSDLLTAVQTAAKQPGVDIISMSWSSDEFSGETTDDSTYFTTPAGHIGGAAALGGAGLPGGITFLAAAGDEGAYGSGSQSGDIEPQYPAASPNVVAVGGTTLGVSGNSWSGETTWGNGASSGTPGGGGGGGGGVSSQESQPAYQSGVVNSTYSTGNGTYTTNQRTYPDVSADANTGVPIYDTWDFGASTPWYTVRGTSLACPLWGGMIALADQGRAIAGVGSLDGPTQTLPLLYKLSAADFHDITAGNAIGPTTSAYVNQVTGVALYAPATGYDLCSGIGTPNSNSTVGNLVVSQLGTIQLAYGQAPTSALAGASITPAVTVNVLDATGSPVTSYDSNITLAIGANPAGGVLEGTSTVAPVNGVATFSGLFIDAPGTGYTLTATNGGLSSVTSAAFNITGNPPVFSGVKLLTPSLTLVPGEVRQFSAVNVNQFGNPMPTQTGIFTWSAVQGTITQTGQYTAPAASANDTVTVHSGTFIATASVFVASPLGYWKFDEDTLATAADSSGNNHPGTIANGAWVPGVSGSALQFNGNDSDVTFSSNSNPGLSGTTNFTLAAWVQTTATSTGVIIQQRGSSNTGQYQLAVNSTGNVTFRVFDRNSGSSAYNQFNFATTETINDGNWHDIVAVRSGNTGYIYIDGVLARSATGSSVFNLTASNSVVIGADTHAQTSFFDGDIDDVRIYNSALSSSAVAGLVDLAPTPAVTTAAAASPNPVTGTTAALSVLGADSASAGSLTYLWSASGPAGVSFSVNGSTAAANTTVTFSQYGAYTFTATIADTYGQFTTSSMGVTVSQTLTSITVSPASANLAAGGTQQFTATALDQFGAPLASQPAFTWTTTVGTLNGSVLTAPVVSAAGTVTASSNGPSGTISGTAAFTDTNTAPTVAMAAAASSNPVAGTTTDLSVLGSDVGEPNLTYTWTASGPAAVGYTDNGSNTANDTIATFTQYGAYDFTVTIVNAGGLSVTSSVSVTVDQTVTSIAVSPPSPSLGTLTYQQFAAVASDQFGNPLATQPTFNWTAASGAINSTTGFYTAPASAAPDTVTAAVGSAHGTASVSVGPGGAIAGTAGQDVFRIVVDANNPASADVYLGNSLDTVSYAYSVPIAGLSQWQVSGPSGALLAVDFSNGNPLPAGGLTFNNTPGTTGNSLVIEGTSGNESVLVSAGSVTVNGLPAIQSSNVQSFGFNLAGQDNLTVSGAAIAVNATIGISSGTTVTVTGGGTVDLNGQTDTVAGVVLAGGSIVDGTLLAASYAVQDGTIDANLSGSGGLTKTTAGTVTLGGDNTYQGGTTVSQGLLILDSSDAIPSGSTMAVYVGAAVVLGDPSLPSDSEAVGGLSPRPAPLTSSSPTAAAVVSASSSGSVSEPAAAPAATATAASAATSATTTAAVAAAAAVVSGSGSGTVSEPAATPAVAQTSVASVPGPSVAVAAASTATAAAHPAAGTPLVSTPIAAPLGKTLPYAVAEALFRSGLGGILRLPAALAAPGIDCLATSHKPPAPIPSISPPASVAAAANSAAAHDAAIQAATARLPSVGVLGLSELAYSQNQQQQAQRDALAGWARDLVLARLG
jgi:autotransporter-associated beta strand protein